MALEQKVRSWLEGSFGVDMGQVRIHTGAEADGLARAFGAEAFTVGADIFFQDGCFNPGSSMGRWLLAHEVAHAARQGGGSGAADAEWVQPYDDLSEYVADEVATLVVSGRKVPGPAAAPQRLTDAATMLVQCHSSWEHRMLGDCNTNSLDVVARSLNKSQGDSGTFLRKMRQLLELWQTDPESVTEAQMREHFPDIRAIRMPRSGLLVTYGELNTLADYLPQPGVLDEQPKSILLPILQTVRQETYNKIGASWLLNEPRRNFVHNLVNWQSGSFGEKILLTRAVGDLTRDVGAEGVGHYYGLLARNACHFAPYSWHRWYQFHMISRDYAMQSFRAGEGPGGENRYKAWLYHGYADHFLQDSFAAGHLVNKTLVMQWFVEWVADKWIPTGDWDQIQTMTTALQPGLAPRSMYTSWPYTGTVKDPETGQEMDTYEARRAASGVSGPGLSSAYSNYLHFLTNGVTQASTVAVHDYYNEQSLWVSSRARTAPFQIWGDGTMLTGGDGVRIASETAMLSQEALLNILASGDHRGITPEIIRDQFPTKAGINQSSVVELPDWHDSVREKAFKELFDFDRATYAAVAAFSRRLGKVSLDDNFTAPRHPVHHWIRRGEGSWYEVTPGLRWSSSTAPAICEYNGKLYAVFAAPNGTLVWNRYGVANGHGQWEWETPQTLGPAGQSYASNFTPTLTVWNNLLYCAYIDRDDPAVRVNFYNGWAWSTPERVPDIFNSINSLTPALAGIGNSLCLAFQGVEGATGGTYLIENHAVLGWGRPQLIPDWNTASPVAACNANGFLRVARRGTEFRINVATRQSGVWAKTQYGDIDSWRTQAGPSMAADGSQLWMAYFGPDNHVHVGRGTTPPDGSISWTHDFSITDDYSQPEAPGLAVFDGQVHVMFRS